MSTFSDEDVQKLKSMGNEENAKVWLGLYDKKVKFEPRVDDEVKQHLIQVTILFAFFIEDNILKMQYFRSMKISAGMFHPTN